MIAKLDVFDLSSWELEKEIKAVKNEFDLDRVQYKILSAYVKGNLTENEFNKLFLLSFKRQSGMHRSRLKRKEKKATR